MLSKDLDQVEHHHAVEEIVDIICNKTQNPDRGFFRVITTYFLSKMAASMRANIKTKDRGEVPVNLYAVALATSGFGKGHSVNILESEILSGFRKKFMEETFPTKAEEHLWKMAIDRAASTGLTEEAEKDKLDKEFRAAGALPFTFDSGTPAAIKQLRQKLLLADCGAINLQIDEFGSNLMQATDVLNVFLELYDQGMIKQKLTKNTNENIRGEELDGKTPTNALLFGVPSKLLDASKTEEEFISFLETGYARRCLFAWGIPPQKMEEELSPTELYHRLIQPQNSAAIQAWQNHFALLGDITKYGWEITVEDDVGIELMAYKIMCKNLSDAMPEHEEIRKAEMLHRYWKALKIAGTFAFVDESSEISMSHLHSAIKLVEESGTAFEKVMTREKDYVKLARFIASSKSRITHADLSQQFSFYKSSSTIRKSLIDMAVSWGYSNHVIIRKDYLDNNIEIFTSETLQETDLTKMKLSWSDHFAYNFKAVEVPFESLGELAKAEKVLHWSNHHFNNQHRAEENVIPGFNMVSVDIDGSISLATVHDLMKDYKFFTYTTKRHTIDENRFRLVLPINYTLSLDVDDYRQFVDNVLEWLPFPSDDTANQRSKKWETFPDTEIFFNHDGKLLDALDFIPKTQRNEHHRNAMQQLESLDNLERWFAQRIATGNRNNHMIKFALALVDSGMPFSEVERSVLSFNSRLPNALAEDEIRNTILVTVAKKVHAPA